MGAWGRGFWERGEAGRWDWRHGPDPGAANPLPRPIADMAEESIIRIPPHHYIHVLDQNSNVTRVEVGPQTYIRQDNER